MAFEAVMKHFAAIFIHRSSSFFFYLSKFTSRHCSLVYYGDMRYVVMEAVVSEIHKFTMYSTRAVVNAVSTSQYLPVSDHNATRSAVIIEQSQEQNPSFSICPLLIFIMFIKCE
jgi:hypothetical protein